MRDQELILRALAFYYEADNYRSPLVSFLNGFMGRHRNIDKDQADDMTRVFSNSIHVIYETIGTSAFRPSRALNAAVFDSVMVGLARRLDCGPIADPAAFKIAYNALMANQVFLDACGRGTAGEERVKTRIALATAAFIGVQ
jgi:hypothetical protein